MDFKSVLYKLAPDWKTFLRRSMPYLLVAVFASATVFAVMGEQNTEQSFAVAADTKDNVEADQQSLAAKQKELAEALAETEKMLDELNAVKADTLLLLEEAQREEDAVADKIEQLEAAYKALENKEQQNWILPIRYTVCTSPFGYRDHPVAGEEKFHYGVDLAAPQGTPIVASRSGIVSKASYVADEEGYYVNIDHLDGYVSRYLHMTNFIVMEGQFVQAGQVIGYCGSTGVSTGPHLHFSIYKNGEIVNPADYIDLY